MKSICDRRMLWMASTPLTFGKDLPYILVGCADRLWSSHYDLEPEQFSECLTALSPVIRYRLTGRRTPSKIIGYSVQQ